MFKGVITTLALALFVIVGPAQAADPIYTGAFSNKAVGGYDTVAYHTENKAVKEQLEAKVTSNKELISGLKSIFQHDQIEKLLSPQSNVNYSQETIDESVFFYCQLGATGYEFLRQKGFPFPSLNTVQRHFKSNKNEG